MVKVADFGLARAVTSATAHRPDRRAAGHRGLPGARAGRARHRRRPQRRLRRRAAAVRDAHRHQGRSPATPPSTWPTSTCTAPCPRPRAGSRPCRPSSTGWSRWRPTVTPTAARWTPTPSCVEVRRSRAALTPAELDRRARSGRRGLEPGRHRGHAAPGRRRPRRAHRRRAGPAADRTHGRVPACRPTARRPLDRPALVPPALAAGRSWPRCSGSPPSPGGSSWPVPARARPSPRWSP